MFSTLTSKQNLGSVGKLPKTFEKLSILKKIYKPFEIKKTKIKHSNFKPQKMSQRFYFLLNRFQLKISKEFENIPTDFEKKLESNILDVILCQPYGYVNDMAIFLWKRMQGEDSLFAD